MPGDSSSVPSPARRKSADPDSRGYVKRNIQPHQYQALFLNEGQNLLIQIEIIAPIGIPLGLFQKLLRVQEPAGPEIQNVLIGIIEHFHTHGQIGSPGCQRFDNPELNLMMRRIGVSFTDINNANAAQISHQFVKRNGSATLGLDNHAFIIAVVRIFYDQLHFLRG